MIFLFFFLVLFVAFLGLFKREESSNKTKTNLIFSFFISVLITGTYQIILAPDNMNLINQKMALEAFLNGNPETKELNREGVNSLVTTLLDKEDVQAGELYIVAKQLKNTQEYKLSSQLFDKIYKNFSQDLDGDIVTEYAQVLYIEQGRKFDKRVSQLLSQALEKSPNNPLALTLKGLYELEQGNFSTTIDLWNKAVLYLNSEKEKNDLKALIETVKKRKNQ